MATPDDHTYAQAKSDRQAYVDAVLASKSRRKIIVAGPGTGKTYLFKQILQSTKNNLILTFINTLVEDLALELYGMSDVKTLHGFARGVMVHATKSDVNMFGRLASVIEEDGVITGRDVVKFEPLFHEMSVKKADLDFYKCRKDYYKHYGFSDVIFAAVKYLETHRHEIPTFDQIVVDEFQDFNLLEVALIDLLAEQNPMVLAGDDDQALYEFKKASPDHIRNRHSDIRPDYEPFNLPYCSRCTQVVVGAVNDIVTAAAHQGYMRGRISKPYLYFSDIKKDDDSRRYSKISYAKLQSKQIPWFIKKCICEIASDVRSPFSVLVISPTRIHRRDITNALSAYGFVNVSRADHSENDELCLLDGLKILLEDGESNLGWRIASKFCLTNDAIAAALGRSEENTAIRFCDLIPRDARVSIRKLLSSLRKIRDEKTVEQEDLEALLGAIGVNEREVAVGAIREDLISEIRGVVDPAVRKIHIRTATIQGSKGLAEDYIFITHFDDQYYLNKDENGNGIISDQNICKFIVAITRARKKVFLLSSNPQKEPVFLKWISDGRIECVFDANRRGF